MPCRTGRSGPSAWAALALAAVVLGLGLGSAGPAAGAVFPWTGTWDTNFGVMKLQQTGTTVTGTYFRAVGAGYNGTIKGTVTGRTLNGFWNENASGFPDDRRIEFVMSENGTSFEGTWSSGGTQFPWGSWHGPRTTPVPPPVSDSGSGADASPAPEGRDSALARLIHRFEDQTETDIKLGLYRRRGKAFRDHARAFRSALRLTAWRGAAEGHAKACARNAGYEYEMYGRQLLNVSEAGRRHWGRRAVNRYKRAAAEHLSRAMDALDCAIGWLPPRLDRDRPPARAAGDSAGVVAFHASDPRIAVRDLVPVEGRMTNCFGRTAIYAGVEFELARGSVLTMTWRYPDGRKVRLEEIAGPRAQTMVVWLNSNRPLGNGVYRLELRTRTRLLDVAVFTRRCR